MKSRIVRQDGFAIIEGLCILAIVGLIGLVGYRVYSARSYIDKQSQRPVASSQKPTAVVPKAPTISSTKDLNSAEQSIDQLNTDDSSSDLKQLDSQTSGL